MYSWSMTDTEIRTMYLQAKNPKKQLRIIADLNGRSIEETVERLNAIGIEVKLPEKRVVIPSEAWTNDELKRLWYLRMSGLSWRQCGEMIGRSEQACIKKRPLMERMFAE
jgi:hypothetical protein